MADVINNNQFGIYRICRTQLMRDRNIAGNWLLSVPQHAITSLNKSTGLTYGTSFDNMKECTLWMVGNGTWAGVTGTSVGLFIGTGRSG